MKNSTKGFLYLLLITYSILGFAVFAYEVNTHQAITRCVISDECSNTGQARSENLYKFVTEDALLKYVNYENELFVGYGKSYLEYASKGEKVFREYNIGFLQAKYSDLIEAGSVLEDSIWSGALITDGRFVSHFYDIQQGGIRLSPGPFVEDRTDAVTWALEGATLTYATPLSETGETGVRTNSYSLEKAYEYYRDSFLSLLETEQKKAQANLFVTLGHLVHMIQDLHSTAHTRDDSHLNRPRFVGDSIS